MKRTIGQNVLTRRQMLQWGAATAAATLAGCKPQASDPLRIAIQPWCGYQFMSLAAKEGWLPPDVQLMRTSTAVETIRAVEAREVHGAALTLDQTLVLNAVVPLQVVLVTNVSAGADVLLARPGIKTLAGLRGKRIGAESTSLGVVMATKMLEAAGLDASEVQIVEMTEDHFQSWQDLEMDAIITYEPALGRLQELGLVPLFDTRSLPQTILDVLAVRRDAVKSHDEQIRALVAGHFRALHSWRMNPLDAAYRLAPMLEMPPERVGPAFQGLDLPDENFNRHFLDGPSQELLQVTVEIAAILRRASMMQAPVAAPERMFTAEFLPATAHR